jgi:hypothetical protein
MAARSARWAPSVGGCVVSATVALWLWLFPALRQVDRPDVRKLFK